MGYFVQNKKGKIVNVTMIQNVVIDKLNPANIVWKIRNGQTFVDEYDNETDASEAYTKLQNALMDAAGGNEDELEAEIHSLKIQVNNLNAEVTTLNNSITEKDSTINNLNIQIADLQSQLAIASDRESLSNELDEAYLLADNIIGEEVSE